MSIISGFNKVKNYVKTTEGYKLLSRWTSSDTVDVNGKTLTETISGINTSINGKANSSHTHGNGDITSLDASKITSGTIDLARLPQGALERLTIVADDTARFKLTSSTIQKGDTVKVTSTGKMYYVVDETKLSTEAGYEVYAAGTAASVPWSGVTGKPSTYTPSSHTHDDRYYTESEIDTKLSGKANSSHTHTTSQITNFPTSMPANGGTADTSKMSAKLQTYKSGSTTETYGTSYPVYAQWSSDGSKVNLKCDNYKTATDYATSAGSASSVAWDNVSGKPSTYSPSSHTHSISNITNLQSTLDGKASASHTHTTVNGHTVNADVPSGAKFTDTDTWRPLGTTADTACAGNDSRLSNARPASDVYAWAKASSKPSYTYSEVGAAAANHSHSGYATTTTTDSLQTQINTINSNLVKRMIIQKNVSDSYCVITPSEMNIPLMYILDVNIQRSPGYGYHFVVGHGVDDSGNLFVYFDGKISATVGIMIHYSKINN